MKWREIEMNIRNDSERSIVYILGAGASKAVIPGAPLMDQLLTEALQELKKLKNHPDTRLEWVKKIEKFIDDFYHLNPKTLPNLEDILTQLDDAIGEDRPLSREYDIPFLRTLRKDLVFAICEVLRIKLGFGNDEGRLLMRSFKEGLGPNDCIISLNYDIIVDNALSLPLHAKLIDYGLSVRYALDRPDWPRPIAYNLLERPQQYIPTLYKLHGSLNWLYCPSCQQLDVTIGRKGVHYIYEEDYEEGRDFACPDCQGRYYPLIITPTLLKTYDNILLREVWRQAEDKVSRADEVVFIGYSLPDADVLLRCMLKRALFRKRNRRGGSSACQISVVDKSPRDGETHKRYIKQFGRVEYHVNGFEGFIRDRNYS
jgi:SIR2-like domain